ncbi:hypothetical protein EJ08DRAFT_300867 [Tothia fuscella]|uniref:Uncharacterized protein n=1 Tax=Tothia fuscella TaxID=1048955 RepID=A0A9P4NP58_9PEZI|nr:hypothetical protein EJ08DRAFT_300867 [Tothia fuscella]
MDTISTPEMDLQADLPVSAKARFDSVNVVVGQHIQQQQQQQQEETQEKRQNRVKEQFELQQHQQIQQQREHLSNSPNYTQSIAYLSQIKSRCPDKHVQFVAMMKDYQLHRITMEDVILWVTRLFVGYPDLIDGFRVFLPEGWDFGFVVRITNPSGVCVKF